MNKRPQHLNATVMRSIFESDQPTTESPIFINKELAVAHDSRFLRGIVRLLDSPFVISDYRFGVICGGEGRSIINLTERRLLPGSIAFLGPGSIVQPISISEDLSVKGMIVFPDFPLPFVPGQMPAAFTGQQTSFVLEPGHPDFQMANRLIDAVWDVVSLRYDHTVLAGLVQSVFQLWNQMFLHSASNRDVSPTREQEIFQRFIQLVNQHAPQQHQIHFYAERLCLSDRYLGTVVHQASGITAKEWIDRALVMNVKVKLRHSNLSLKQIADEMCFPNTSFFSKYFRRMTGQTPQAYREGA